MLTPTPYFPPFFDGYLRARGRTLRAVILERWGDLFEGGPPDHVLDGTVEGAMRTDVATVHLLVRATDGVPWYVPSPAWPGAPRADCGRLCLGILPD